MRSRSGATPDTRPITALHPKRSLPHRTRCPGVLLEKHRGSEHAHPRKLRMHGPDVRNAWRRVDGERRSVWGSLRLFLRCLLVLPLPCLLQILSDSEFYSRCSDISLMAPMLALLAENPTEIGYVS